VGPVGPIAERSVRPLRCRKSNSIRDRTLGCRCENELGFASAEFKFECAGFVGFDGGIGLDGFVGFVGLVGLDGIVGLDGFVGLDGVAGFVGPVGPVAERSVRPLRCRKSNSIGD
jgi:hypothetical protein